MFFRKKLDEVSRTMLLGRVVQDRSAQLQRANPTMSEKEADTVAAQEALESLRAERIDITSRTEVEAWAARFRSGTPHQAATAESADFRLIADELRDMFRMMNSEAESQGGSYYFPPEVVAAVQAFINQPNQATASALLKVSPPLRSFFEAWSPGGHLYEQKRFLAGLDEED